MISVVKKFNDMSAVFMLISVTDGRTETDRQNCDSINRVCTQRTYRTGFSSRDN